MTIYERFVKFHFAKNVPKTYAGMKVKHKERKALESLMFNEFLPIYNKYRRAVSSIGYSGGVTGKVGRWEIFKTIPSGQFTSERGEVMCRVIVRIEKE
jgi:hypothetical protein